MPALTSAHNKARELYLSRDKRALHRFLEEWRLGDHRVTTDYILSVINEFTSLENCGTLPDQIVGDLRLKFGSQRAFWKGMDVDFTVTEFRIVKLLIDRLGDFTPYRVIYDSVHYTGFVAGTGVAGYCTNVRSIIKRLRRKFEKVDPNFDQIENYSSVGYRWKEPIALLPVPIPVPATVIPSDNPPVIDGKPVEN